MKISIVTIYEPITNYGSFLQCYALKTFLEQQGHQVKIVQNVSPLKIITKKLLTLNPKREMLLRFQKCYYMYKDLKNLDIISRSKWNPFEFDCIIYGSDEIWNLNNPYFRNQFFWGIGVKTPKIAYAVSCGHMPAEELNKFPQCRDAIADFNIIFPRDKRTRDLLKSYNNLNEELVCDPTMLVPLSYLSLQIKVPKRKYILVYTYGLSIQHISLVTRFAKEKDLIIVSPCFWHIWADKVVECSALQLSTLIEGAEYVFTTTFHGAVFTLLNHKQCGIFAQREKVREVVELYGASQHLINEKCDYNKFCYTLELPFHEKDFESRLNDIRIYSQQVLNNTLYALYHD